MHDTETIKVWDIFVRFFHWALVATFAVAYLTEDDFMTLHAWSGYAVGTLILLRILWGVVGTPYARFSDFVTSPAVALNYVKDTLMLRAKRYIGHNPAGGLMIVALLISLLLTTFTGVAVYAGEENAGPLAGIAFFRRWDDAFEETHEFFANFTLFLVVIHVAGVVLESLIHRENLVSAMITGFKRGSTKIASTR